MALHHVVEQLTVVGCDILDVAEVFQASLNLEGGDTGGYHVGQSLRGVEVA